VLQDFAVVVRRQYPMLQLLWSNGETLERAFRDLRSKTVLTQFASMGFIKGFAGAEGVPPPKIGEAPFLPYLGPVLLTHRSLPAHEWIFCQGDGGVSSWPPFYRLPDGQHDETLWPVPLAVEPRRLRLTRVAPNQTAPKIVSRLQIHLYPLGVISVMLTFVIRSSTVLTTKDVILLIQELADLECNQPAEIELVGTQIKGTATAVTDEVAHVAATAILGSSGAVNRLQASGTSFFLGLCVKPAELDLQTIAGLIELDPKYQHLDSNYVGSFQKRYGRYAGDIVVPTVRGTLINIDPDVGQGAQSGFFWRLVAIAELVQLHRALCPVARNHLNSHLSLDTQPSDGAIDEVKRVLRLMDQLQNFPEGLPPRHREFFRVYADVIGLQRFIEGYDQASSAIRRQKFWREILSEVKIMDQSQKFYGPVTNSNIVHLVQSRVDGSINQFTQKHPQQDDLGKAVKAMHDQVRDLVAQLAAQDPEAASAASDNLEAMTEEVTRVKPRKGVLRSHGESLIKAAQNVAAIAVPVAATVKVVLGLFGIVLP
jgi:hypothetical protein